MTWREAWSQAGAIFLSITRAFHPACRQTLTTKLKMSLRNAQILRSSDCYCVIAYSLSKLQNLNRQSSKFCRASPKDQRRLFPLFFLLMTPWNTLPFDVVSLPFFFLFLLAFVADADADLRAVFAVQHKIIEKWKASRFLSNRRLLLVSTDNSAYVL